MILKNKGICLLHDLILEPIKQLENSVENFTSIISFPDNKILISNGITNWRLYDLTTKQFEKFETPAQKYLDEHRLYFISRIDENKFAVVTKTGGLVILSKKGEIIQVLNEEKGLPAGRIYSVSTDNLGNLWLCMQKGICKIDINYPATIAGKLQNMNKYVLSACSYNGIRYIGTLDGIYYLPENTISKNYNPVYRKIESFDNSCWDITTMNNLIIAGGGNYLVVLKGSSKKLLLYLNGLTSRCLTNSKNYPDILFFGVHNRLGYLRLNPKATFENVKILEEGYFPEIDDVVFSITEDNDGNLWVNTKNNGIYFIRFENSNVKNYKITHLSTNNGLPDVKRTRTFILDSNIFVTTNTGIVQANLPNANEPDSLISFTYTNFFGKEIKRQMQYIIKVDENNYLLKGETILNITKTPKEIVTDSIQFKRLVSNFDELTPFLNDDKTISFGATEAFINYNLKSKRDFTKPFNVAIRKVTIDTDSVLFDGTFYRHSDSLRVPVLNQPLEEIPEIDFKLNAVTFQYSGLFYEDPQGTQYSYKLVGYSKKWSEWSNENKAVFTNLREGEYAFQVKARNVYLAESDVATYQFKIHHPWYTAWWAYLIYVFFIVGFVWLIVKLSVHRLRKQNERLELTVSDRTKEINQQKEKIELQNKQLEKFNQERVKELQAFFALSKVLYDNNINIDKICQELLRILSQSFQFHDITTVRIAIFDRIYESKNFTDSKWKISAPIKIGESVQGSIDVVYAEETPKEFEGPFLKEERSLLNAMAERLGDIIKRLQAEEKIRENKERLQNIFNNLQDAYFETDQNGKFTTISPSAITIYGCSSFEEMQDLHAQDLYADPQDREKLLSLLKEKKSVSDFVCLGKKIDNSTFWVSMSVQFKYNNDGEISGTIGVIRDITERKNAEIAIAESEANFREVLENSQDASYKRNLITNSYDYLSPVYYQIAGFTQEDIDSLPLNSIVELIHPEDIPEVNRVIDKALSCNDVCNFQVEYRFKHKNIDKYVWLLDRFNVMHNEVGEPIALIGSVSDITDRKNAEVIIEESEFRLKLATASGGLGIWDWNLIENKMMWDDRMFELYGISKTDFPNNIEAWENGLHPEDKQKAIDECNAAIDGVKNFDTGFRVLHPDGKVLHLKADGLVVRNAEGVPIRMIGINRDITENVLAEDQQIIAKEKAEKNEEKVTRIIESTIDFIWTVDPVNFGIETYNSALYNYFLNDAGIKMKIGDTPDVLVSSRAEDWKNYYRKALELGTFEIEYDVVANENILHLSLNTLTRNNKVFGISVFGRDITRLKKNELELIKAKEKAEESNRLKTAFLNNISHEIRTPLNGILGFAPFAVQPDISDEEKQEFLKILNFSSERLMNTVTDYMDMSLIVSGAMLVNRKEVDIESLLRTLCLKFNEPCNEKNLQLKLQYPTNRIEFVLIADEELLKKAVSHLLYNALKFTKEGTITFGYEIKSNNLEIFVKDTGVGIGREAKEIIFEAFMQENISNTRAHEGSGLGLSIANGLIKLLDGKIRIESEKLKGTNVFITLPIEPTSTNKENDVSSKKNALKETTSKIMIVEDDDVSCLFLETILKNVSNKIIRAINGEEAIEISKKYSDIDLVLMDIQMPGLNGYEATRQIRQFNKNVIIIAQTAYGLTGDREKALDAGCNDYISKPIKKKELLALIQKYFEK